MRVKKKILKIPTHHLGRRGKVGAEERDKKKANKKV